jgi:hypothetical protein
MSEMDNFRAKRKKKKQKRKKNSKASDMATTDSGRHIHNINKVSHPSITQRWS